MGEDDNSQETQKPHAISWNLHPGAPGSVTPLDPGAGLKPPLRPERTAKPCHAGLVGYSNHPAEGHSSGPTSRNWEEGIETKSARKTGITIIFRAKPGRGPNPPEPKPETALQPPPQPHWRSNMPKRRCAKQTYPTFTPSNIIARVLPGPCSSRALAEVPGFQITLTSTRDVVTVHTDEEGRVALVPRDCW